MALTFKLEHPDGTPADPPTLKSAAVWLGIALDVGTARDRAVRVSTYIWE